MNHLPSLRIFVVLPFTITIALVGCGSSSNDNESSSNATSPATCDHAGTRLCERAVECAGDGTARLLLASDAGTSFVESKSKADCLTLYVTFGCSNGGDGSIDFGACASDIETAACGADSFGKKGLLSPRSCSSAKK